MPSGTVAIEVREIEQGGIVYAASRAAQQCFERHFF
jgi:hypothetical protein